MLLGVAAGMLKYMTHGRRTPLLLSPRLNYLLFGTFFAGNVAVLVALLLGTSKHADALASIASSAAAAETRQREANSPPAPPAPVHEREASEPQGANSFRVSLPEGWQWRGCMAGSNSVEILMTPASPP